MKVALFLLLIIGMTLSFAAIGLVMLFATGTVKNLSEAKNLFMHGEAASDSSLVALDEVESMQDALAQLQQQRQELDKVLEEMKADTSSLIQRKAAIEQEVQGLLPQQAQAQQKKAQLRAEQLALLIKLYDTMKPVDAASIMDQMDIDLVLQILPNLRLRQQAKILSAMTDEARKVQITEMLAGKKPGSESTPTPGASAAAPPPQTGL
jgi:flagellar motility protein MotE (MotC chaperone)